MKWEKAESVCGTWRQGYVDATYSELFEAFGSEHSRGDDFKTTCEWHIKFKDGTIATIYDWKQNVNYCGETDGIHYEDCEHWNIGGNRSEAVEYVKRILSEPVVEPTLCPLESKYEC